jgi:radical SAM superfamily enzyme YgiQ (UPF0313 family)
MRILLITPPMTQLNTPYPATAYISGFLRSRGYEVHQADFALDLALKIFSKSGLSRVKESLLRKLSTKGAKKKIPASVNFFLENFSRYEECVEPTIRFLQNKDSSLALRIVSRDFIPEGPQFEVLQQFENVGSEGDSDPLAWAFGSLGIQDRAKYLASLLINDLAAVIKDGVDPKFELARYGEKLAASQPTFDPMQEALNSEPTIIDEFLDELTREIMNKVKPDVVGLTVPFPGNVFAAFRIAKVAKALNPKILTVLGGGYVNTELRGLTEARVFNYFDRIVLDDGYQPILSLLENFKDPQKSPLLLRTFVRENGKVILKTSAELHDIPQKDVGTPTYEGLHFDRYLSILEMLNPMHRIWSDGRWNKLTVAQGCYWKKCTFCDIGLDYIGRYEPNTGDVLVDRIEKLIQETGQSGFHFVDEAAPPAVLRAMAEALIRRKVVISWWGNIRFEKTFTPELCQLLARSGCVAISGGLEVASDRLLELMQKGVTVEQVARVSRAFTDAGVMVHAYLMYGFPSETEQETVDSLERVRQLFLSGCIQSAYWHRFAATAHSPIGLNPKDYGIKIKKGPAVSFSHNDLDFVDSTGVNHDRLGVGLKKALYNFMHGMGFEKPAHHWFEDFKAPKTKVKANLIEKALEIEEA